MSHIKEHEGDKPFSCEICFKSFTRISTLKYHKVRHEEKFPFKCDLCEQAFAARITRPSLFSHARKDHPHAFECEKFVLVTLIVPEYF